jgi:ribosomal protein S18 acetylase RimI-like enzyme
MHVRLIQANDGLLLKDVTRRSVEDAPYAFGGAQTLAEETARPDSEWCQLAAACAGEVEKWRDRCVGYFVVDGDTVCGKAICYLCDRAPRRAYLTGVWIDSRCRRRGLGRSLVREACAWATAKGADHLKLWVDDPNPAGAEFYRLLGFRATGESRPISSTSDVQQRAFEIALPVDWPAAVNHR